MELAKPRVDIGLSTNHLEPMLAFWQGEAGIPFDHLLKIRRGQDQHRHDALGSVLKINHHADPLPDTPATGYRELIVARPGLTAPKALTDPDGARVTLVPPGHEGVTQIGIRLAVRDLAAHRRFYTHGLGLTEETPGAFRAGETLLILEESPDAPSDAGMSGKGWRYITFQVFKVDEEHARILEKGGRQAMPPTTLGTTARISMVRDPDGNWIEISQRASIVGTLGAH
ncbi:VOC family protein [Phenylobacterium sp.]|uniref:VOC family protein n=1 Tax=Phenylobacterium sp. TaxID=1871053 RepID=UPI002718AC57|nr:VOC family protein [Phenylobacterium sp.]MDO8802681.1 VOC family protein [Phenylobacterium sp.]